MQRNSDTSDARDASLGPDNQGRAIGRHLLVDLHGVAPAMLRAGERLLSLLGESLRRHGFHVLSESCHAFPDPGGVTGFILLSESHAAFHTYPEHGYAAFDLFSCGAEAEPEAVVEDLRRELAPAEVRLAVVRRGDLSDSPQCAESTRNPR